MGGSADQFNNDSDERRAEQLGEIADEMADRLAAHRHIELSEYIERYPDLADMLPGIYSSVRGLSSWLDSDDAKPSNAENLSLGDYRLLREIGRGGMGIVYEAEQLSLRRPVAVKVFPFASVLEPYKLQRFKNEALAAATLEHPHIVPVHSVGVERGTHFYAMRLIQGASLAAVIRKFHSEKHAKISHESLNDLFEEPRDASNDGGETPGATYGSTLNSRTSAERSEYQRRVAAWIRDVAGALHYAHHLGIVHRDVKPANLLIDEQQKVWVTDFGLASGINEATMTLTGDLLGTLPYMSPEQTSGKRQLVDERTDIYSLGVTLYEALTGRKPFNTDNRSELIQLISNVEARIPSRTQRLLSPDLVNVTLKAMARDPRERYGSAKELADDLTRFLEGKPVVARRPSILGRSIRWIKRNRAVSTAAAIVVACLALVTIQSQLSNLRIRKSSAALNHHLYVADVSLAADALEQNNVVQARELLSHHVPRAGEPDLRGFAWHLLWDTVNPAEAKFDEHQTYVNSIDWSPDGTEIVSAAEDGQLLVWDHSNGKRSRGLPKWPVAVSCVRYSPTGDKLAVVDVDGVLAVLIPASGETLARTRAHDGNVRMVSFSPDGTLLATASTNDGHLRVFDAATLERKLDIGSHGQVNSVGFFDDGKRLASCGSDKRIRLWDIKSAEQVKEIHLDGIRNITVSPDGASLVANTSYGQLRKYNLPNLNELGVWNVSGERLYEVRFSPDGRYLVACGKDRLVRVVDANTGELLRTLSGHDRRVFAASFSPSAANVATASADGTCLVYDISKETNNVIYQNDDVIGTTASLSKDGRWLAFENGRGDWYLRDNLSGKLRSLPATHLVNGRLSVGYSVDGSFVATTGGPVMSWGRTEKTEIRTPSEPFSIDLDCDGDLDRVTMVAPNGRLLWQECLDDRQFAAARILPIRDVRVPQVQIRVDEDAWNLAAMTLEVQSFAGSSEGIDRTRLRLSTTTKKFLIVEHAGLKQLVVWTRGQDFLQLHTVKDGKPGSFHDLPVPAAGPAIIVAVDIDGDDQEDLVVARPQHRTLEWYRRLGAWEFAPGDVITDALVQPSIVFAEDIDDDGQSDLVTSDGGYVVWLRGTGRGGFEPPRRLQKPLQELRASMTPLPNVAVWDTNAGKLCPTFLPLEHHPRDVALSADGKIIATCGDGNHVRIRHREGEQLAVTELPNDPQVEALSFSPAGERLAVCHGDDCVLLNAVTGKIDATLQGHESTVHQAVFSNDGRRLATLSNDLTIVVWDVESGRRFRTIYGLKERTSCARFSLEDDTLAVGTRDGALFLFDVESGQKLCTLARYKGMGVESVSFQNDRTLVAIVLDGESSMLRLMSFEAGR